MPLYALIVDSNDVQRELIKNRLSTKDWEVIEAKSSIEGLTVVDKYPWSLIFCNTYIMSKETSSVESISQLRSRVGNKVQIIVTLDSQVKNVNAALHSILHGASDFLYLPHDVDEISIKSKEIIRRYKACQLELEKKEPELILGSSSPLPNKQQCEIVGQSEAMVNVLKNIARMSCRDIAQNNDEENYPVPLQSPRLRSYLITGETGTGKELIARFIHACSPYSKGPFVPFNCSNFTPELADNYILGHDRGSFTGALSKELGLFEKGNGGTVFLDEITTAPISVLPKLLRIIQDGEVNRIGAKDSVKVNVQIIAATNRNIEQEVQQGNFPQDLFYRLDQRRIELPALRERLEDIPSLVAHFVRKNGGNILFSDEAIKSLQQYWWPGNIRELENEIDGFMQRSIDGRVLAADISDRLELLIQKHGFKHRSITSPCLNKEGSNSSIKGNQTVRDITRIAVREVLEKNGGNKTRAAKELGLSRAALYNILDEETKIRLGRNKVTKGSIW
jgi:DNA-binding NtrC family response regulator